MLQVLTPSSSSNPHMSLLSPHPLITTCGSNPYEINKTVIQLKLLSGRYRCDKLLSNFHHSNPPTCQLNCDKPNAVGDIQHLLTDCSTLSTRRTILFEYWDIIASKNPLCINIINTIKSGPQDQLLQFILDCSTIPDVIRLVESNGEEVLTPLFKMSRTFCYSIHRERLKILNRWRF